MAMTRICPRRYVAREVSEVAHILQCTSCQHKSSCVSFVIQGFFQHKCSAQVPKSWGADGLSSRISGQYIFQFGHSGSLHGLAQQPMHWLGVLDYCIVCDCGDSSRRC